jgi:hypothetical protein
MKKQYSYEKLGKRTAIITFLIASLICLLFLFTGDTKYGFRGYFFFLGALVVNFSIMIFLLVKASNSENSKKIYRSITWMLLNIPLAIFYFMMGIYFIGTIRITIENNSGSDIENMSITGCENKNIDLIKNGETENVWINIPNDCSIQLHYQNAKGDAQYETIMSYVTSGMGRKIIHKVGKGENW